MIKSSSVAIRRIGFNSCSNFEVSMSEISPEQRPKSVPCDVSTITSSPFDKAKSRGSK